MIATCTNVDDSRDIRAGHIPEDQPKQAIERYIGPIARSLFGEILLTLYGDATIVRLVLVLHKLISSTLFAGRPRCPH